MPDIFDEIGETKTKPAGDVFDEISPEIPKPQPWELSPTGQKPYLGQFSGGPGSPYEEINREEALNIFKSLVEPPIAAPTFKGETTLGKVAAGVGNVAGGIYNMLASPVGLATLPLAGTKIGAPIVKGVFGGLAAKTAGEQLGEASVTGDVQQYTEGLLNALLAPGIALPGKFGYIEPENVRMAKEMAREIGRAEPTIEPTTPEAIRQLGVRIPEGPFAQPGIPELASAALGERFQMVKPAGAPEEGALMDLRRALEPPRVEIAQPVARAERIQGGGQAPYGKVSFMREAEAPLPERTQAALAEPAPKPAEPAPVEPAVPVSEPPKPTEVKPESVTEGGVKSTTTKNEQRTVQKLDIKPTEQRRIETYGERYIRESGLDAARKRIEHLNVRTEEELAQRPIDQNAIRRLQQEAQNIANAVSAHEDNLVLNKLTQEGLSKETARDVFSGKIPIEQAVREMLEPFEKKVGESPNELIPVGHDAALKQAYEQATQRVNDILSGKNPDTGLPESPSSTEAKSQPTPPPPSPEAQAKPAAEGGIYPPWASPELAAGIKRAMLQKPGEFAPFPEWENATADQKRLLLASGFEFRNESGNMQIAPKLSKEKRVSKIKFIETPTAPKPEAKPAAAPTEAKTEQPPPQPSAGIEVKKQGAEGKAQPQDKLLVRFGESHRKYKQQRDAFFSAGMTIQDAGAWTLGSKARAGVIPDTPEARALAKKLGITIARKQWPHLKKSVSERPQPGPGAQTVGETPTKGIVTGRAIEKWADDQLRGGGTHLGPDVLAAYIVKGVALIERGIINFAEWSARMIAEHGDKVKPHLRELFAAAQETVKRATPTQTGDLKSAREIVEQRIRAMTEGETVKMRKSAARATESPAIPEPVQEKISEAPESFYRVQPNELVEEAVKRMSDAELVSVPAESNLFVAARLEAANRLFTAGEMDKGYQIFVELEKQGTSFGQNINQFKRLPGTLPEHTAFLINQKLKNAGKDPLTKQQEAKAIDLTKVSKQADAELDRATEAWRKDPTDANASKAQDALLKSNNAAIALQRFIGAFDPRGTASVLKSILQGNLLTPISEVANLFGNMSFLPFRAMDRSIASGLDIIDNAVRGKGREVSVSPIGGTAAALGGAKHGLSRVPEIMFRGTGDTIKGEKHAGLHPVRAWINQFSKNPEMPTTGGKLTLKDRINLALEGTFGVPAEMMLRGLGAGDQPFKEAARARVITEQLRLKNVPQSQWAFARQFPELFFDRATMEQIKGDTLSAVFQRNSRTIGHMMNWIRGKGDVFDLALATVAPYKLTPWNLVGEILSYNPVVAFSKAALEAKRGNTRSAKLNAGKFVVGSMLTSAGWWLYQNGLLSPSLDERTEAQKARVLADQVLPPNHINISGLQRKLAGGDPTYKPGDRTVDIFRAGGLAGSIFYMTANIGRDFEKQPETQSAEHLGAIIRQSTLEQARFGLNQSFLSGVEGILTAVKDGNTDNYVRQYMNTVLSIPLPNSLATLSRATREFQPEFRAEGFGKQVENTVRNKLGFAGLDDYLPLKRGLWGEPLPQTPKGANELFYQFFDITKSRQVTDDPVPIELYRLWRKTADTRAIPSLPEKTLTIGGITYALNPEQRSRYAELVGKYRRQMADAIVINPAFHKLNDDQKLDMLDQLYREGLQTGKTFFWAESKDKLQPKAERAGFK